MCKRIMFVLVICFSFYVSVFAANPKELEFGSPSEAPLASPKLPKQGIYPQLLTAIFKGSGYSAKVRFYPFPRTMVDLKKSNPRFAGGLMVSYKPEREKFLVYPKNPLYEVKINIYCISCTPVSLQGEEALKSLTGTVGTKLGSFVDKLLRGFGIKTDPHPKIENNIQKLFKRRLDFIIAPHVLTAPLVNRLYSSQTDRDSFEVYATFKVDKHYVGFSKNYPNVKKIVEVFDKGIRRIEKSGEYDRITGQ